MSNGNSASTIFKTVFSVSTILLLAKLLGFVKHIIVANAFGATLETDIILLSQGVITDFEYLVSQTMITAFIPIYIALKENYGNEKHFVSNVLKVFMVLSLALSTLIYFFAPVVSKILAPSYQGTAADSLIYNIKIYAFSLGILVITAIYNALLKANKSFLPGEITSVNQSAVFIICVLLLGKVFGVKTLILSFFIYALINIIYLGVFSRKLWAIELGKFAFDENIKQLLKMMAPLLFGYAMIYINQLVDKILASGLGDGTVTAMSYSAVLSNFITGFIGSICGIAFIYIAQNVAEKSDEKAASIVGYFITFFVTILIPISIVSVTNANEIVTIVFGRGAFDENAVGNSTYALMGYGCIFIPYVLRELFTRLQYSYQDSKRPVVNSTISIVCNIILSIIFREFWGIFGITIASSIAVLVCAILNIRASRKYNRYLNISQFRKQLFFWVVGGVVCLVINILLGQILQMPNVYLRFAIRVVASLCAYGIVISPILAYVIRERRIFKKSNLMKL